MATKTLNRLSISIVAIFAMVVSVLADEAEDRTKLAQLKSAFVELNNQSSDIDAKIDAANDVFKFAQKTFGKRSAEYANALLLMAATYDVKGGIFKNRDENKARNYYERYFDLAEKLKLPRDEAYIDAKVAYIKTLYSTKGRRTEFKPIADLISLAEDSGISEQKISSIEIELAEQGMYTIGKKNGQILLSSALNRYKNSYGLQSIEYAELLVLIGKFNSSNLTSAASMENFETAIAILDNYDLDEIKIKNKTHSYLVEYYETIGKSDLATVHCQSLAIERAPGSSAPPPILYGYYPQFSYDDDLLPRKFEVNVEFNIGIDGKTKDIKLMESTNDYAAKIVMDTISTWRYTPIKYKGELIEVNNVPFGISFTK